MHHHEPFKALAPIEWAELDPHSDTTPALLTKTFADTQTLIESIPDLPSSKSASTPAGRARAATDSAAMAPHVTTTKGTASGDEEVAAKIRKDWKEAKVAAKDNPMGITVWKLSSKDGKGAWFARRSVHRELGFDRWKEGLEREFEQTLGVKADNPDVQLEGKIRGIGAERRVDDTVVDGVARLQVYQLSVRFPGPTTPRDFVTLLITSTPDLQEGKAKHRKPRQMVVISKPCAHPECPERQGFIRGQYESVEVIREVPIDKPMRRARSSLDLAGDGFARPAVDVSQDIGKQARLRSANKAAESDDTRHAQSDIGPEDEEDEVEYAIEWLMITRSDPGGSVPRFMVEKGTPPGICSDAGRFVKWLFSEDFTKSKSAQAGDEAAETPEVTDGAPALPRRKPTQLDNNLEPVQEVQTPGVEHTGEATSGGFYGMIANAIEAAGSVVSSRLPAGLAVPGMAADSENEEDALLGQESDTTTSESEAVSFASAEEVQTKPSDIPPALPKRTGTPEQFTARSVRSVRSVSEASETPSMLAASHQDKELRKLESRRRRADKKWAKIQEKALARTRDGDKSAKEKEKEEAALAKLKEKHERERAKQEEKYAKEVRKLEEKRAAEERKAEERRRKQAEKEAKENSQVELERARAERDVALKQADILREQVGELQAQNTLLAAKLGKTGERVADDAAAAAAVATTTTTAATTAGSD